MTEKYKIVNDQSNVSYDVRNEFIYNRKVLKDFWFQWSLHLVRGDITVIEHEVTQVAIKICSLLTKSIAKIDGTAIDDPADSDLVMPMYNLVEYSWNYSQKERKFMVLLKRWSNYFKCWK